MQSIRKMSYSHQTSNNNSDLETAARSLLPDNAHIRNVRFNDSAADDLNEIDRSISNQIEKTISVARLSDRYPEAQEELISGLGNEHLGLVSSTQGAMNSYKR